MGLRIFHFLSCSYPDPARIKIMHYTHQHSTCRVEFQVCNFCRAVPNAICETYRPKVFELKKLLGEKNLFNVSFRCSQKRDLKVCKSCFWR